LRQLLHHRHPWTAWLPCLRSHTTGIQVSNQGPTINSMDLTECTDLGSVRESKKERRNGEGT
jgi:hypothetical protein